MELHMATTTKRDDSKLTLRQRKGRVVNAVAQLLRKRLAVPNIYLEPRTDYITADVLAVESEPVREIYMPLISLSNPSLRTQHRVNLARRIANSNLGERRRF